MSFPPGLDIEGIDDSKRLGSATRERLFETIISEASGWSVGMVEAAEIDRTGMSCAIRLSFSRAALSMASRTDLFLIDGLPVSLDIPAEFLVRGDSRSMSIAAAGIVAKVTRDRIMTEADDSYPGYGFMSNKGYGTPEHISALAKLGPCPLHRRSFAPLRYGRQMRFALE